MIVAQEGYQDTEYGTPKKILEDAGIEVVTASKKVGTCQGSLGGNTTAEVSISDLNIYDYNAIIFVGGPGARIFQQDPEAHLTAQEAINKGKILAAICIAPTILAYAGVLEGKKATVWNQDNQQEQVLKQNGATFVDEPVVVDGKIITANGPGAAEEFGKKIVGLLKENQ